MCGIAGIWGATDERLVGRMMDRLVHRGPDAAGLHTTTSGVLGHRRLSIMDPIGGDQPIRSGRGDLAIIANGEVYNHPQLFEQLSTQVDYTTHSDSESALHLYDLGGPESVGDLDGMFALAIADDDELFLARDPIGIKPLYYGRDGGAFLFASEIKALIGLATDIREFPPGAWYHSGLGFQRYFELPRREPRQATVAQHGRLIRRTLEAAVVKRLMSDVPVGAFLSGGLDSSLIAAIARPHLDALHTFSVGTADSPDLEAARLVARHLDTIHHEYVITPDEVLEALPTIIYHLESYDQDLVRSAIPCYFTSRLAAEHVKVILTGEGADELFAGYRYYDEYDDETALQEELRRSVSSLHNINLQRVDRMTMAHSIEGRVPFLDIRMIEAAQSVPASLKRRAVGDGRVVEKWILRHACSDLLPDEIVWRTKSQFDEGSGTVDLLTDALPKQAACDFEVACAGTDPPTGLRSVEECFYHQLLTEVYPDPTAVIENVARWAQRPAELTTVGGHSNP